MIYSNITNKAMQIAYIAHSKQKDRAGVPYIFHPIHLAEQMETEDEICVALLHDVVEDSEISLEDLAKLGFNSNIIEAIKLLSRKVDTSYFEYIECIKYNDIARKVKIADLKHNSDLTRLKKITDKDIKRQEKYRIALQMLGCSM